MGFYIFMWIIVALITMAGCIYFGEDSWLQSDWDSNESQFAIYMKAILIGAGAGLVWPLSILIGLLYGFCLWIKKMKNKYTNKEGGK